MRWFLAVSLVLVVGCSAATPSVGDGGAVSGDGGGDGGSATSDPMQTLQKGHVYITARAHAEDSPKTEKPDAWVKWTSIAMPAWQARGAGVVAWAAAHGYTLDLSVTPDSVNAIVAAGAYKGAANWIAWSVLQVSTGGVPAVRWGGRAHGNSDYSAADSAYVLDGAGAPYNGVLGSFETLADYAGNVAGKTYPQAPARHFTILTGGTTEPGHPQSQTVWPAGIYGSVADQSVVNGGWEEQGTNLAALWRAVEGGTVNIGIRTLQFDLGEKTSRPNGWAVGISGDPLDTAVDAMFAALPVAQREKTHIIGFERLVKAWKAAGSPVIAYDEGLLK